MRKHATAPTSSPAAVGLARLSAACVFAETSAAVFAARRTVPVALRHGPWNQHVLSIDLGAHQGLKRGAEFNRLYANRAVIENWKRKRTRPPTLEPNTWQPSNDAAIRLAGSAFRILSVAGGPDRVLASCRTRSRSMRVDFGTRLRWDFDARMAAPNLATHTEITSVFRNHHATLRDAFELRGSLRTD